VKDPVVALALAVVALAFLAVIPQGSASALTFIVAVALVFLVVILSEVKNPLFPVLP
jgi:hypothetical protein